MADDPDRGEAAEDVEDQMSPDCGRLRSSAIGWAGTPRTRAGTRLTNAFSEKVENHAAAVA